MKRRQSSRLDIEEEILPEWLKQRIATIPRALIILKGIPGSPGRVKGKVRIIRSAKEALRLREGEILVAPETNPDYLPAMLLASAIITDRGGALSHAAIVARELGIPAVVGTLHATNILKDGMEVVVDGTLGLVLKSEQGVKA